MSVLVEFRGGPLDGERHELQSAPPVYRVPYFRARDGVHGFEDYRLRVRRRGGNRLSDRYQLPPLVYEYIGLFLPPAEERQHG